MNLADLMDRYAAVFGEGPPLMFWAGTDEQLALVLDDAIRAGAPVSQNDLVRLQGGEPAPPGAIH